VREFGKTLHEHLYLSKRREYEEAGLNAEEVDYFPTTRAFFRKLLTVSQTQQQTNDEIQSIWAFLGLIPNTPAGGISQQQYNQILQNNVLAQMQRVFDLTFTVILPGIYNAMFNFANAQLPPDYYGDFGSIENGTDTASNFGATFSCKATMDDPYKCCAAASTSYECCYGLIGCVPEVPAWAYQRYTTSGNLLERWTCTTTQSFIDWWTYFVKALITAFVEITRFFLGFVAVGTPIESIVPKTTIYVLPMNFFFCMVVNLHQGFIGVFYLFAIYVFISSQVFTWFFISLSGFNAKIKAENDQTLAKYNQRRKEIENSSEYGKLRQMTEVKFYQ